MPPPEEDEESSPESGGSAFGEDAGSDDGLDFDAEEGEAEASGHHSESVFVVDDEEAGRDSYLMRTSIELEAAAERTAFAEEVQAGEAPTFVDADPSALDAAAGVAAISANEASREDVVRRHLRGLLEALLFVVDRPMKVADLADVARADQKEVRSILEELSQTLREEGRGFQLDELAGGFQLRTSAAFAPFVRELTAHKPVKLSRPQVETLAIVAYRQPITRPEIDDIRGVDAGAVLKLLLDRDLVRVLGKKDEPGRPLLYGTTTNFLTFFGLKHLRDLPTLREFTELSDESREVVERELGEPEVAPTAVIGDASIAASDEMPAESFTRGEASPLNPESESESESGPESIPAEAPKVAHAEADEPAETASAEEATEAPAEKPGGTAYDPSDEALYPDDEDDDFDDEDEDDDEEDGEDEDDKDDDTA